MEVGCRQATQVTVKNSKGELLAVVDDNGVPPSEMWLFR